jgi:thiol-disulfide isomerase/thioredoxin
MAARIMDFVNNLTMVHKAIIGVVLLVVAYFAYGWFQKRNQQGMQMLQQRPSANTGGAESASGELICTMYHVDWCKFCKKAKPEWAKLEADFHGKVINGKRIAIVNVDCDQNEEIAERENIKGYPSFKFKMNDKYFDFPDEPVYDKLKTFIEYVTTQA